MNHDEYVEKLQKAVFRRNLLELVILYCLGTLFIGAWLLGVLDPLPASIYGEDMDPGARLFVKLIFWVFGVVGIYWLGSAISTTIHFWRSGWRPPENCDDYLI